AALPEQASLHRLGSGERLDDVQLWRVALQEGAQPAGVARGLGALAVVEQGVHPPRPAHPAASKGCRPGLPPGTPGRRFGWFGCAGTSWAVVFCSIRPACVLPLSSIISEDPDRASPGPEDTRRAAALRWRAGGAARCSGCEGWQCGRVRAATA